MTKPCRFCGFIHAPGAPHGPEVDWAGDTGKPTRATKIEPPKPVRRLSRQEMEDAEMRAIGLEPAPRPRNRLGRVPIQEFAYEPPIPAVEVNPVAKDLVERVVAAGGGEPETAEARALVPEQRRPPTKSKSRGVRQKQASEAEANAEWVRGIRAKTGLTQEAFAAKYGFNIRTVMSWEQGRAEPGCTATRKLVEIDHGN